MPRSTRSLQARISVGLCACLAYVGPIVLPGIASAQATYTWNANGQNSWTNAANWTPARIAPAANDVIVFDGAITPSPVIDSVATQTIGRLVLQNGGVIGMRAATASPATLTIAGGTGADLDVPASSLLMIFGGALLKFDLGPGATGAIAGRVDIGGQITAADPGALVFASGSTCTGMGSPSGHVFGTTSLNSVVFQAGSAYVSSGSSDPFGAAAPLSVVTFETGSTYRHTQTPPPSLSGRTYADFVMAGGGGSGNFTGTEAFTVDNLTVQSASMHLRMATVNIRGSVNAFAQDLAFDATSAQAVNLEGSTRQVLTASTNLFSSTNVTIHVTNPAGVEFARPTLIRGELALEGGSVTAGAMFSVELGGQIAFGDGLFHTGPNELVVQTGATLTGVTPTSYVNGNLRKPVAVAAGTTALSFEIGDATTYAPVEVSFPSVSVAGTLTASTAAGDHASVAASGIDAAKSANRTWTIVNNGIAFAPSTLTFHFAPGDVDAGAQTSEFHVARFTAPSTWTPLPMGTRTATSTRTSGVASFGAFEVGERLPPIAITVRAGSGKFGVKQPLPLPGYLVDVAITDLNGDGRPDLLVPLPGSNVVQVRLGLSSGGLGAPVDHPTSLGPVTMGLGDLNSDGIPDLVTSNYGVNNESILLGDGTGGFASSITQQTGANSGARAIVDLDGDGFGDLVQVDGSGMSVMLGDGTGHFGPRTATPLGWLITNVAVADLNEDDKADLAFTTNNGSRVLVLLGDGAGGFGSPTPYNTPGASNSAAFGDMNGDGHVDLVVANAQASSVSVLLGDGQGALSTQVSYPCGAVPHDMVATDFDGDGHLDVATVNYVSEAVSVLRGDGSGGLGPAVSYPVGPTPQRMAAGDLTGDGVTDLVAVSSAQNGGLALLPGLGGIAVATDLTGGNSASGVALRPGLGGSVSSAIEPASLLPGADLRYDFTADPGHAISDILVDGVSQGPITSYTFTNLAASHTLDVAFQTAFEIHATIGSGEFATRTDVPIAVGNWKTEIGDLNRDGVLDLVTASGSSNVLSVLIADGAGGYEPNLELATPAGPTDVAIADLNRDGRPDLVVWSYFPGVISVFAGDGLGGFGPRLDYPSDGAHSTQFAIGDLNGDGLKDVVTLHYGDANLVTVRLGDGIGGFGAPTDFVAGGQPYGGAIADLNGDGKADLVTVNPGLGTLSVQLGDGLGGLGSATTYPAGSDPGAVVIADLNHDGKPDAALADLLGNAAVLLGDGAGQFSAPTSHPVVGSTPSTIAAADLDGDSHLDLVLPITLADSSIGVLFGTGTGSFLPCVRFAGPEQPFSVTVGDVDGNGAPDLVAPAYPYGYLSILKALGGSIAPGGVTPVVAGGSKTFTLTPEPGYEVLRVRIDGVDQGAVNSVSFTNVSAPHTVSVAVQREVTATPGPPLPVAFALEAPRPSPGRAPDLTVSFGLPTAGPARLEVIDAAGRMVSTRDVGAFGPGRHTVSLANGRPLPAGVYWVRLAQGPSRRTRKVIALP